MTSVHRLTANTQYELPFGIELGGVWQYSTGGPVQHHYG